MADKTTGGLPAVQEAAISGLPGILDLYDETLIPVEQQGEARHMTGAQWKAYAVVGVDQYVKGAQEAAGKAQEAAETAKKASMESESKAQDAANSAAMARQYSGNPPAVIDGTWWVWNAESQQYEDTGTRAVINPRGEYDPGAEYQRLDIVSYQGSSFVALKPVAGVAPEDGESWAVIAERGAPGLDGAPGNNIQSIERTSGNGAPGTRDTYTVTLTDGSTTTFQVYNGANGEGAGDMTADVYDPQGKKTDIFKYVEEHSGKGSMLEEVYDPQGKRQDIFKYVDDHTPKDAVTAPGGGTMQVPDGLGPGPYTFEMTEGEDGVASITGQPGQVVGFGEDGAAKAVPGWSNPNLLDNGYFLDPVNQRGQSAYPQNGGFNYTIDRWVSNCAVTVMSGNGLRIRSAPSVYERFSQRLDVPLRPGDVVTLTFLVADPVGNWYIEFSYNKPNAPDLTYLGFKKVTEPGISLVTTTVHIPSDWNYATPPSVYISHDGIDVNEGYITLFAAKLELGSVQTLAHKEGDTWVLNDPPPNKALELAKCQRYYEICSLQGVSSGVSFIDFFVPYKVTKRAAPAVLVQDLKGNSNSISVWNGESFDSAQAQMSAVNTGRQIDGVRVSASNVRTNSIISGIVIADSDL